MKDENVNIKSINRKIKVQEMKNRCKEKINGVVTWCKENKELAIVGATGIASAIGFTAKNLIRHNNIRKQAEVKDEYIYDRRHGHYIKLRRAPKQSEWTEIDSRKDRGENLNQILQDLRLL